MIDPLNGLRDAQGGYGTKKKTTARPGGPYLSGGALDPAIQGRLNGGGATAYSGPASITTPGFTPDYKSLIENDPVFAQLRADIKAQGYGDLASRNAGLNRLFTGFGALPDINAAGQSLGINDLGQAIDPATAQLAADNPYSTTARLGTAHTDAIRQIRQGLAARGALQSGELGFQLGKENTAYGQAQNDSTQALLDAIAQLQGGFVANQRAGQAALGQGANSAADRQVALNPAKGSATATYDPTTGKYKGPNGEWYEQDGTPIQGTPQAIPPAAPPFDSSGSQAGGATPYQNNTGGLNIGAFLAPGVASGHRLDPRYENF